MAKEFPLCSMIVVNFNGKKHLDACLRSLEELDYASKQIEIFIVDNGSDDGSEVDALEKHPQVRLLRNSSNNFASALNLGIAQSKGAFVAFINNDVFLYPAWLTALVGVLEKDLRIGCAGGKILFEDGRINSVGHRTLPDFYWEDDGYGEEDHQQYDVEREVDGLCWAAVLFRRACLEKVGPIDEDFVMYYEDVDLSQRASKQGWKIVYHPGAVARHVFHGSSQGSMLAEFFSDRNRLFNLAKHHPEALARAIDTSRFLINGDGELLYEALPLILKKLIVHQPAEAVDRVLEAVQKVLTSHFGSLAVDHLLSRLQVILGHRKVSIGFYDHALNVIGGGQKYGCMMAAALQHSYDVTLLASKPVALADLEKWYGLSLSACRLNIISMPFFEKSGSWIDSAAVTPGVANPFETVSLASQGFDVLVNVNMQTMVVPLSPFAIFLCHFPEAARGPYFAVQDYSCLLVNSRYTREWVRTLWGLSPDGLLYPPVEMTAAPAEKENLILSVARFEPGGSKKQHELLGAYEQLWKSYPDIMKGWRLVLAGGSLPQNGYLAEIEQMAKKSRLPVEVLSNLSLSELQGLYARARIFWHACGLGETNPHLIEHFGMSTVEAMQNRCVPIVFNGGGQREIVEHGRSGYRFDSVHDLCQYTLEVIVDPDLRQKIEEEAYQRAQIFSRSHFEEFVRNFFRGLEEEYRATSVPDPRDILHKRVRPNIFYSSVARRLGEHSRQ
jgi:GT2 family glycosyltransferase